MNREISKTHKTATAALSIGLSALIGLTSVFPAALAAPATKTAAPQQYARQQARTARIDRRDILLVMPGESSNGDDVKQALEEAHGTVISCLGSGKMQVLIIQAEHGKAAELQKKLASDTKNFAAVDANVSSACDYVPSPAPSAFTDSWHLQYMHVPEAWDVLIKSHAPFAYPIAIFDSGLKSLDVSLSAHGADVTGQEALDGLKMFTRLAFKSVDDNIDDIIHLGNYIETLSLGIGDQNGHGTWVASVATASMYHKNGSIGMNPLTKTFPIRIASGPPGTISTDELAEVTAFMVVLQKAGTRIVNISYANVFDPNKKILAKIMQYYHDKQGGLIFCSAGNSGQQLTQPNVPYLIVVSAMEKVDTTKKPADQKIALASQSVNGVFSSNYGTPIDFTAPGSVIDTENTDGTTAQVYGTSFASPILAGVASLVWTINPKLTNDQVEGILRASCKNTTTGWNQNFGWGVPDAQKAANLALGG